ncbi:MAG: IPT/TIG domain-containing protein [Candidatus Sericytochromatia bacterium]|nr:IPT/TIG domain-containing protein [Candidatus Tanganyikabacteria bacterium]
MRIKITLIVALLAGGCNVALNPTSVPRRTPTPSPAGTALPGDPNAANLPASASVTPEASGSPTASASPSSTVSPAASGSPAPTPTPTDPPIATDKIPAGAFYGVVLDPEGRPAEGVTVTAYKDGANPLVESPVAGSASSGADGIFLMFPSATGTFNLEAVRSASSKAWKGRVAYPASGSAVPAGALRLGPVATIRGKVIAPDAPTISLAGIDVYVPGSKYTAGTDNLGAFAIPGLAAGMFDIAAAKAGAGEARTADVQVIPGVDVTAPDLRLGVKSPRVTSLTPTNGGPGVEITIAGDYFGASASESFEVKFNSVKAASPTRVNDRTIKVNVPSGVGSGNVTVVVNGITSDGLFFPILGALAFNPGDVDLLVGKTVTQVLTATDTRGLAIPNPAVTWSLAGNGATLGGSDLGKRDVTATAASDTTVKVTSGSVSKTATIRGFKILQVSLSSTSIKINGLPADGSPPDPGFVTSATIAATVTASDRAGRTVVWSSSNPNLVSVSNGIVAAKPTATGGLATITAKSADDDTKLATASVEVTAAGELNVGIR